jgi:RNA polymerase sigma-70 factor (ECF subfamily)
MGPTDEDLVNAFQAGNLAAFDLLVRRWERKIQGAIYRVMGTEEDARDICQEAFLKAYRALGSFKREARFSSWLYQIALNLCRDRMRRRRGRTMLSLDAMDDEGASLPLRQPPSPLELAEGGAIARAVAAAVSGLPDEQREVIVLKEYQDLTFLEIAQILDVPLSTVKTRLYRGLGQLRQRLERQGIRSASPVPAPLP